MKRIYTFLCLFLFGGVAGADEWFCVADQTAGVFYIDSHWKALGAKDDHKFLFRRLKDDDEFSFDLSEMGVEWIGITIGKNEPFLWCASAEFTETFPDTYFCDSVKAGQSFHFHRETLRYVYSDLGQSYVVGGTLRRGDRYVYPQTEDEAATPYVQTGKCSSL